MVAGKKRLCRSTLSIVETFFHAGNIGYALMVVIIAPHLVVSTRVVPEFAVRLRKDVGEVLCHQQVFI